METAHSSPRGGHEALQDHPNQQQGERNLSQHHDRHRPQLESRFESLGRTLPPIDTLNSGPPSATRASSQAASGYSPTALSAYSQSHATPAEPRLSWNNSPTSPSSQRPRSLSNSNHFSHLFDAPTNRLDSIHQRSQIHANVPGVEGTSHIGTRPSGAGDIHHHHPSPNGTSNAYSYYSNSGATAEQATDPFRAGVSGGSYSTSIPAPSAAPGSLASTPVASHMYAPHGYQPANSSHHDYASVRPTFHGSAPPQRYEVVHREPPTRQHARYNLSERDEQAASTLATMPNTPQSPPRPHSQTGTIACSRTEDGQILLPGQQILDERSHDLYHLMRDRRRLPAPQLTPHLSASAAAAAAAYESPSIPTAFKEVPAHSYNCLGRTGISDEAVTPSWPEPPKSATSKRSLEATHYATPGASPDEREGSTSKRQNTKGQTAIKSEAQDAFPSFEFIAQGDNQAGKKIRQHVMRRHRRYQKDEKEKDLRRRGIDPDAQKNRITKKVPAKNKKPPKGKPAPLDTKAISTPDATVATTGIYSPESLSGNDVSIKTRPSSGNLTPESSDASQSSGGQRQLFMPRQDLMLDSDSEPEGTFMSDLRRQRPDQTVDQWKDLTPKQMEYIMQHPMNDPLAAAAADCPDPFNRQLTEMMNLGISIKGYDPKELWNHFQWTMPSLMDNSVTGNQFNRIGWLYSTVSILDPNPVPTVLGYTASHIASLYKQQEPAWAIEFKMKAISLINERLRDPTVQVSDGNIGAVLLLIFFEFIFCNPKEASVHLDGVRRMIQSRPGGYLSISLNPYLEAAVLRVETIRAYLAISEHRFYAWKAVKKLPDFIVDVGPEAFSPNNTNLNDHYSYRFCADGLRLINRLEAVLLRLQNLGASGADLDRGGIRKIITVAIRAALDLDEDPASIWNSHISRKVMRLAAIVQIDITAKEIFDTRPRINPNPLLPYDQHLLPQRTFIKRFKKRYLGGNSEPAKAAAWGRTIEMVIYTLLMASEPNREKPWRGFYFADALILASKLTVEQWRDIETELLSYVDNWGYTDSEESERSRNYFNLKNTTSEFLTSWDEFERVYRMANRHQAPAFV